MARIIPGVEVSVVKEVVPPQLAPSGILGIVGITEASLFGGSQIKVYRAGSWNALKEKCGASVTNTIKEAKSALENGIFELAIAPIDIKDFAVCEIKENTNTLFKTVALHEDIANNWTVNLSFADRKNAVFSVKDAANLTKESFTISSEVLFESNKLNKSLVMQSINTQSQYVLVSLAGGDTTITNSTDVTVLVVKGTFTQALDESKVLLAYENALNLLKNESDVDLVTASLPESFSQSKRTAVYSKIIAHCNTMAKDSKPAIGIGQVPLNVDAATAKSMKDNLVSDRFVLLAGQRNVIGAVAGTIGNLDYYASPTFKNLNGLGVYENTLGISDQNELLQANIVPIVNQNGRGIIILRGLTTDGDQINVRRIADRAVRGVKLIGELFIGRLNTDSGRTSLSEKIKEFLLQMQKENAIVPSTNGLDPAFKLDVYSSQADFAQGIVRIDLAVRPVRAIDFIYATILVQA